MNSEILLPLLENWVYFLAAPQSKQYHPPPLASQADNQAEMLEEDGNCLRDEQVLRGVSLTKGVKGVHMPTALQAKSPGAAWNRYHYLLPTGLLKACPLKMRLSAVSWPLSKFTFLSFSNTSRQSLLCTVPVCVNFSYQSNCAKYTLRG